MNDITFIIAVVIINLLIAQVAFVVFRYFILRRQGHYEAELKNLTDQVEKGTLSKLLFQQVKEDLRRKYDVKFYEKWFGGE